MGRKYWKVSKVLLSFALGSPSLLSLTMLIPFTCCYDLTKGTPQDKDFSYSFSILSTVSPVLHSVCLSVCLSVTLSLCLALTCVCHCSMIGASYDWRLTPPLLESRDRFFTRMMEQTEAMVEADPQRRPAVVIGFSLGCRIAKYFIHFCHANREPGWMDRSTTALYAYSL